MNTTLGTLEKVDLRSAWATEAQHFTPWLASEVGLKLLGDAIGVELEREAEEQPVGPFKADILARRTDTPDEHWVLIENQLEPTDHRHLGQLLTYAAGLEAVTIVWVAAEFTPEHRAALDWLNEITDDRFEFFGLEVEVWRIGHSPAAPKFNVVASPNDWRRTLREGVRAAEAPVTPVKQLQLRYWQALRSELTARNSTVRPRAPRPQHWTTFSAARSGVWLTAVANTRNDEIAVQFCMNVRRNRARAKRWFHELLADKDAIEAGVSAPLAWEELPNKLSSRVALYRRNTDPENEADWPAQHLWLAETLERFTKAFRPRVAALPDMPEAGGEEAPEAEYEPEL
jgi:hypothetical protein